MRRLALAFSLLIGLVAPTFALAPSQVATVAGPPANQPLAWTGFAPASLGASLKVFLTPDDHGTARMTDAGAGIISSWTSNDGSALTVTATTTARPTWTSNAITGADGVTTCAGLTFDGTANIMTSATLTNVPTGATAGELLALGTQTEAAASANTRNVVAYGAAAGVGQRKLQRFPVTLNRLWVSDGSTNLTDTALDLSGVHLMGGSWSGTIMAGRMDGRAISPASTTIASLNTSTTVFKVGGGTNGVGFWKGVIRHIFVTSILTVATPSTPLLQPQEQQLEAWTAWGCGSQSLLPYNHPFRWRKP